MQLQRHHYLPTYSPTKKMLDCLSRRHSSNSNRDSHSFDLSFLQNIIRCTSNSSICLLDGIEGCPSCSNIIHITGNSVTSPDMNLLSRGVKLMKVITRQLNSNRVNENFVTIASQTDDSIQTLEQDILATWPALPSVVYFPLYATLIDRLCQCLMGRPLGVWV